MKRHLIKRNNLSLVKLLINLSVVFLQREYAT